MPLWLDLCEKVSILLEFHIYITPLSIALHLELTINA